MQNLRIGCAAGGSGDRVDAAAPVVAALIASGKPSVLIFENQAERTRALAQLARRAYSATGDEPLLEAHLRPILADRLRHAIAIAIVSNFGATNPRAAADRVHRLAAELGLPRPRVAVVEEDDLSDEAGAWTASRACWHATRWRRAAASTRPGHDPNGGAVRAGPCTRGRQGQPRQHRSVRVSARAVPAAGRAGHAGARGRAVGQPHAEAVRRDLLPRLHGFNLVLENALDGGGNESLNLDMHGKALSFLLLGMPLQLANANL